MEKAEMERMVSLMYQAKLSPNKAAVIAFATITADSAFNDSALIIWDPFLNGQVGDYIDRKDPTNTNLRLQTLIGKKIRDFTTLYGKEGVFAESIRSDVKYYFIECETKSIETVVRSESSLTISRVHPVNLDGTRSVLVFTVRQSDADMLFKYLVPFEDRKKGILWRMQKKIVDMHTKSVMSILEGLLSDLIDSILKDDNYKLNDKDSMQELYTNHPQLYYYDKLLKMGEAYEALVAWIKDPIDFSDEIRTFFKNDNEYPRFSDNDLALITSYSPDSKNGDEEMDCFINGLVDILSEEFMEKLKGSKIPKFNCERSLEYS
ncbi:hypothetical protein JTB14_014165 [Gonioctena quinquepunctata]|nr:hypothetical protein JTB14_014165 [Gonioctena quinquepunctata]